MAAARLLSVALDGVPSPLAFALWAGEAVGMALSLAALRIHRRASVDPAGAADRADPVGGR